MSDSTSQRTQEANELRAEIYRLAVRVYYAAYGRGLYGAPDARLLRRVRSLKRVLEKVTDRLEKTTK